MELSTLFETEFVGEDVKLVDSTSREIADMIFGDTKMYNGLRQYARKLVENVDFAEDLLHDTYSRLKRREASGKGFEELQLTNRNGEDFSYSAYEFVKRYMKLSANNIMYKAGKKQEEADFEVSVGLRCGNGDDSDEEIMSMSEAAYNNAKVIEYDFESFEKTFDLEHDITYLINKYNDEYPVASVLSSVIDMLNKKIDMTTEEFIASMASVAPLQGAPEEIKDIMKSVISVLMNR